MTDAIPRWWTVIAVRARGARSWTDLPRPVVERSVVPAMISAGHVEARSRSDGQREVYEVRAINGGKHAAA